MSAFDVDTFLAHLPRLPGVYRMFDQADEILYVGKAKSLRSRVTSYFRKGATDSKTMALVGHIARVETTVTSSETEALLLEQSLIKEHRPPYNVVFRDDKSYPYIYLATEDEYPRLAFHRGAQKRKGRYFGPFPSAYSVRDSLNILQKVFRVRQCEDTFFRNRSRPCLQYQIKRCSGPCCGLTTREDYADDVQHAAMFLEGKSNDVIGDYANKMEAAAEALEFERAAIYRDQITHLRKVQEQQYVVGDQGDIDIVAAVLKPGGACVLVMYVRGGRMLGNKTYFPQTPMQSSPSELLEAFVPQFYLSGSGNREIPREVVLNAKYDVAEKAAIEAALSEVSGRRCSLSDSVRSHRARWAELAETNAEQALATHLANRQNIGQRYLALQDILQLDEPPERLECFDISHTAGEATVASCVVFDGAGPMKSDYRRFNIEGITPGDDYAAMAQALHRRYTRVSESKVKRPDVLFIDGGLGQLRAAEEILTGLDVEGVVLVGVAKGPDRRVGLEKLYRADMGELDVAADNPGLHLIQHIRDESHRFAITAHRGRRAKARQQSTLETIEGVGPKRRRALLRHFGGNRQVEAASVEELAKAPGISRKLAEHIYAVLHNVT
ncbi:MAG: excinuclease ABC subunit C [Gammaproteobacteria bacterium]|nr:excinuclease ABC subunit C [Gammaproteobacteria bacterium]